MNKNYFMYLYIYIYLGKYIFIFSHNSFNAAILEFQKCLFPVQNISKLCIISHSIYFFDLYYYISNGSHRMMIFFFILHEIHIILLINASYNIDLCVLLTTKLLNYLFLFTVLHSLIINLVLILRKIIRVRIFSVGDCDFHKILNKVCCFLPYVDKTITPFKFSARNSRNYYLNCINHALCKMFPFLSY